jgi:hypothetical protein
MALSDIEAGIPWRTCGVCHHMTERGDDWAETLRRLLANRGIKFRDLAKALHDDPDEPNIPWETLSRHARAGCSAGEHLR